MLIEDFDRGRLVELRLRSTSSDFTIGLFIIAVHMLIQIKHNCRRSFHSKLRHRVNNPSVVRCIARRLSEHGLGEVETQIILINSVEILHTRGCINPRLIMISLRG